MKSLLVLAAVIYSVHAAIKIKCNIADGRGAVIVCPTNDFVKCKSPVLSEYTGLSDQEYGCGACSSETEGITCASCDGNADVACNAPIAVKTFNCFDWHWVEGDNWHANEYSTKCTAGIDTDIICNKPNRDSGAIGSDYIVPNAGCGPCLPAHIELTACLQCNEEECNSAAPLSFVILPLIAAFFNLM